MDTEQWLTVQRARRDELRSGATTSRSADTPVSVIVVTYNAAEVLGRCLRQLLAQEYSNFEIVVVDDGSQDETVAVAERELSDGKVRIVRSPTHKGCAHARNQGLEKASGELIAFIDADGFADPSWLARVVAPLEGDDTVGAVASTVFFAFNPLVINGAGGTVNRQGWAADLSMSQSYERAEIASEALYAMGCGMTLRRSAIDRVGPFDDRMLNYYDDVDYGMRVWRAGYRVVVAPDAWIDHAFSLDGANSTRKRLLCERHRMRVVLKHAPAGALAEWALHEARGLRRAQPARRALKLRAAAWNARHLPSVLAGRWRQRRSGLLPGRLIAQTWGDDFPAGLPPILTPRPDLARDRIDMAEPASQAQLVHGWFPLEQVSGRSYRWAATQASVLVRLNAPARRLRLDYSHVPVDTGGVDVFIRRLDAVTPLTPVWSERLQWQYVARSIENRPLELPAGDYEVVFSAREGWFEPPLQMRALALAVSSMSLHDSFEIAPGGLDMASPDVEAQLVSGWFEAEQSVHRNYRWASGHAAAVVRLSDSVSSACVSYRMPPVGSGDVTVSVRELASDEPVWSQRIGRRDGPWHEEVFSLRLDAGEYMVTFDAGQTWSNPGQQDRMLPPENRSLGFALSSLSFLPTTSELQVRANCRPRRLPTSGPRRSQ